jgi:hypothetical protein
MLGSDAELNSASNGDIFEGDGGHRAKKTGEGQGEDVLMRSSHPRPPYFLPDDPPLKYHHSIENLILHLTQAFRTLAQV